MNYTEAKAKLLAQLQESDWAPAVVTEHCVIERIEYDVATDNLNIIARWKE